MQYLAERELHTALVDSWQLARQQYCEDMQLFVATLASLKGPDADAVTPSAPPMPLPTMQVCLRRCWRTQAATALTQ